MIYWFKKLANDEIVPIEGDRQAALVFLRGDFKNKFEYIGKSDGSAYKKVVSSMPKITKKKAEEMAMANEVYTEEQATLIKQAMDAELEVARNNPDKTRPIYHKVRDMAGNPITSGVIYDTVKMMTR